MVLAPALLRLLAVVTAVDAAIFGGAWFLERWWYQRKRRVG
jgi:hypothetical protein